jgi:diguanylate cyclase (GGDEF)-like protein/PAS domain S-box-containing protein
MVGDDDFLAYAFDHTESGVAIVSSDGTVLRANRAGAALIGRSPEQVVDIGFLGFLHPDDLEEALSALGATLEEGHGGPVELRVARPDGSWVWIRARATLLPTPEPSTYVVFDDITAEHQVADRLAQAHAQQGAVATLGNAALAGVPVPVLAQQATDLVVATLEVPYASVLLDDGHPDGLLLVAATGRFEQAVGTFRRPRDSSVTSVTTRGGPTLSDDLRLERRWTPQSRLVDSGIVSVAGAAIEPRSGAPGVLSAGAEASGRFDADDLSFLEAMGNVLASAIDATQALEHLRHNALHDALTGLPNRVLVLDRLELALEQAVGRGTQVAVLVCDLDRFKVVNDGMGHAAGDEVLRTVADRLRLEVRPGDTVGRFGGDEFVIVCPDVADLDAVIAIADRLAAVAREPAAVFGTELVATVSIGIAVGGEAGEAAAAGLLRDADAAMYRAKDRGRARWELFDDEMRTRASVRLRTETELRRALELGELVLHYQPIISMVTDDVVGVEALMRWHHPDRGLLEPGAFVGVAGESGLVPELGAWAFREATHQVAQWTEEGWWERRWVAVNLAPRQLADRRLLEQIDGALASSGVDPTLVRVELTEDALVDDSTQTAGFLDGLRERGLGISVDDFGTGYSSLAYLKRLPIDALKLDRSFVAGLGEDGDDVVIAAAVIVMAQALGLRVVAEGVETSAQLEVLRAMGCDLVQGYLYTPALPPDALAVWIRARA